jgi:hypothetical protein
MAIVRLLGRVWIPLVVLLVVGCEAFVVSRIHGVLAAENHPKVPAATGGPSAGTEPFNAKQVLYQVFGPAGATADISYFDVNSEPQQVDGARLPWSLTMTVNSTSVIADVVAQGDGDSIGCRIVVDGAVRAERISNEVSAYTHCLAKGA